MRLTRRLAAYQRLPAVDRRLARGALSMLVLSRFALLVLPVDHWRLRLRRRAQRYHLPPVQGSDQAALAAARTGAIVLSAARGMWPSPSCLHRSLVVEALLESRGVPVQLRFGVRRSRERLEAHCWAEHAGIALTPPDDEHGSYLPMQLV